MSIFLGFPIVKSFQTFVISNIYCLCSSLLYFDMFCLFNPLHYNNTNLMMMAVFIQVIVQLYRILPQNTVGMKLQENLDNPY